jgi:hypothetical protein
VETQQSTYRNEMPCWREIEIERELGERREKEIDERDGLD